MATSGDAERLRRLQLVTDAALAHLDLDELLAELLTRIRSALETDTAAVLLLDETRKELVAHSAVGLEEEVEHGIRSPLGAGFAGRIAAERRPIVLDDVDRADDINPILREKGVKSLLGVPLVFGNRVLGVLHVGTLSPRDFTHEDVELLEVFAKTASIAIEHARLFAAEREARMRLERLEAVTDAALGYLELDELLAELLARTRELLETDTAAVLLSTKREGSSSPELQSALRRRLPRAFASHSGKGSPAASPLSAVRWCSTTSTTRTRSTRSSTRKGSRACSERR
jgi:GAF domain-containing protein